MAKGMGRFAAVLAGLLVAGLIGLFAARHIRAMERRDDSLGLASALGGELRVIAELLEVDADLRNLDGADAAKEVLARIEGARTVFDGSAGRLGLLPHPIPDQLVRFYGRVPAKIRSMERLVSSESFFAKKTDDTWRQGDMREEYEAARLLLREEGKIVRDDLHKFFRA
jgi:hypothetical protein